MPAASSRSKFTSWPMRSTGRSAPLGQTIRLIAPVEVGGGSKRQSLTELVDDMRAGKVDTLLMLGVNPVYNAPAGLDFAKAPAARAVLRVALRSTTTRLPIACTWRIPAAHEYEAWGDARAFDGTITIQQPQVGRLYGGHSAQEVLAVLQGDTAPDDYTLRAHFWQQRAQQGGRVAISSTFWHEAVRTGVVDEQRRGAGHGSRQSADIAAIATAAAEPPAIGLAPLFRPDEGIWDGRYADNPWLLEMPRPFTRLTWDNAALIAPATAKRLGLDTEDVVEIASARAK